MAGRRATKPQTFRAAAAVTAILASCAPARSPAATVWTALATEKIRPSEPARAPSSAHLSAARNEFEAFQIAITGAATGVRASASDLSGPGTVANVRLYREELIDLAFASALDGGTGRWPDALVPDVDEIVGERRNAFPFRVGDGETRAIWVQVFVPPGTPAGEYTGSVRVTWDGGDATVPVSLTVRPFTLPSTASLKSAFGFSYGGIPAEHGLWGDDFALLRARYGTFALDHRVTLSRVDDGNFDLSHIAAFHGPAFDGTAPTRLSGARLTSFELLGPASSWSPFFESRGWLDRLFQYTCDEPPLQCRWEDIPARASAAHSASPPVRTLVTTTIQQADENGVTSSIDILAPVVNFLDDRPGASRFSGDQRPAYDAFLAASPSREVWGYQSCMSHGCGGTVNMGSPNEWDRYFTGWPTYVIDASAVRNRAMQWLAFRYRLSGELYYETVMAYGQDAWANQYECSGNGDGTLFYPGTPARIGGTTHVPVGSIRLEMIREGMEDFEYLKLLSDAGGDADARAIAAELFPHPYSTEVPPEALMAAREKLAGLIVARGATGSPDGGGAGAVAAPMPVACAAGPGGLLSLGLSLAGIAFLRARRRTRRPGRAAPSRGASPGPWPCVPPGMAASQGWHENEEALSSKTKDLHRAFVSLEEEIEAMDWYQQRIDATRDPELRAILEHNRDEEKEHAMMLLEWIRRHDAPFARMIAEHVGRAGAIVSEEDKADAAGDAAVEGSPTDGGR